MVPLAIAMRARGHELCWATGPDGCATLAALALGIPQLVLPQAADQFLNAPAVARAGAGIAILPGQVDAVNVEVNYGPFKGRASARSWGE